MRVDIFPSLNTPEDLRLPRLHRHEPRPDRGLHRQPARAVFPVRRRHPGHRTRNIQQVALCELSFFPGTDMGQAMAQVVAMSDRAMSWMPKGTLPPMIMRMDAGSVPVGYLVFESEEDLAGSDGRPGAERRSGRWCRNTSPARWRSRRSARTCGRSSSTSIPRSCSTTT